MHSPIWPLLMHHTAQPLQRSLHDKHLLRLIRECRPSSTTRFGNSSDSPPIAPPSGYSVYLYLAVAQLLKDSWLV
jgi:hypothetical protein